MSVNLWSHVLITFISLTSDFLKLVKNCPLDFKFVRLDEHSLQEAHDLVVVELVV